MRKFKFRVRDNSGNFEYFEIGENTDRYGYFRVFANEYGSIIEQYTGLKDRNGKEIYEGDIVKWNDCIMKVIWENDCACFELAYPDNSIEEGMFVNEYMKIWIVIGNIHENPELIKRQEITTKTIDNLSIII